MRRSHRKYRKKVFFLLLVLLIVFAVLFFISLRNPSFIFFNVGLPNSVQNKMITWLSFFSIFLVVRDIKRL
ncbi:MAG: hypothetical protein Q8Q01_03820 [archaeon]|nr:hypothetical protein [archaeon]